jgi:hypothetical protein
MEIYFVNTVKLGYNDHGYNEITALINKRKANFWSQMVNLLHKFSWFFRCHNYNEHTVKLGYNEQLGAGHFCSL